MLESKYICAGSDLLLNISLSVGHRLLDSCKWVDHSQFTLMIYPLLKSVILEKQNTSSVNLFLKFICTIYYLMFVTYASLHKPAFAAYIPSWHYLSSYLSPFELDLLSCLDKLYLYAMFYQYQTCQSVYHISPQPNTLSLIPTTPAVCPNIHVMSYPNHTCCAVYKILPQCICIHYIQ